MRGAGDSVYEPSNLFLRGQEKAKGGKSTAPEGKERRITSKKAQRGSGGGAQMVLGGLCGHQLVELASPISSRSQRRYYSSPYQKISSRVSHNKGRKVRRRPGGQLEDFVGSR